jgi:hypothetical protein
VDDFRLSGLGPRGIWNLADDAFDLYRSRFTLLCGIAAVVYAPAYLAVTAILLHKLDAVRQITTESEASDLLFGAAMESVLIAAPILFAAFMFHSAATATVVSTELLTGKRLTILGAYRDVLRRFFPMFFATLLAAFATLLGSLAFTIGALYVMIVLSFLPQVIMIERKGVGGAWRRTQDLARVEFLRIAGLLLLIWIPSFFLFWGLYAGGYFLLDVLPLGSDAVLRQTRQALVAEAVSALTGMFFAPLFGIGLTLLYYDIRVRREGLDIIARAEEIGLPLAPDPFGEMTSERARSRYFKQQKKQRRTK